MFTFEKKIRLLFLVVTLPANAADDSCHFHSHQFNDTADSNCAQFLIQDTIAKTVAFPCRILQEPKPPELLGFDKPAPAIDFPSNCAGDCLDKKLSELDSLLSTAIQKYKAINEIRARYKFSLDISERSQSTYTYILHKFNNPVFNMPSGGGSCQNPFLLLWLQRLIRESTFLVDNSKNQLNSVNTNLENVRQSRDALINQLETLYTQKCETFSYTFSLTRIMKPEEKQDCNRILSVLDKYPEDSIANSLYDYGRLAWNMFSSNGAQVAKDVLQEHPGLRYFLLDKTNFLQGTGRTLAGVLSLMNGMTPLQSQFVDIFLSNQTSEQDFDFFLNDDFLKLIDQMNNTSDDIGLLKLIKIWTKTNPELAAQFRQYIYKNYQPFRKILITLINTSERLTSSQKELLVDILNSPEFDNPDVSLGYVDLLLNITSIDFSKDPLALVKQISDFVWNPLNEAQVKAGKEIAKRNLEKIKSVTIEALRNYNGRVSLNGKQMLGDGQMKFIELALQKTAPKDFDYILDFALSIARSTAFDDRMVSLGSFLKNPRLLDFSQQFIIENIEVFREAVLETLEQYKGEIKNGPNPLLSDDQFFLIEALIKSATGNGIKKIINFMHDIVLADSIETKNSAIIRVLSDKELIDSAKKFAGNEEYHKLFIRAAERTLLQFESNLVRDKGGIITKSQFRLAKIVLKELSARSSILAIDSAYKISSSKKFTEKISVLRNILRDKTNIIGIKSFIDENESGEVWEKDNSNNYFDIFKSALLDTLNEFKKDLTDKENGALSQNQFGLLIDLASQVGKDGMKTFIEYLHSFLIANTPTQKIDILEKLLGNPSIVKSIISYTKNKKKLTLVKNSIIEILIKYQNEILISKKNSDGGILTTSQFELIKYLLNNLQPETIEATLNLTKRLILAKSGDDKLDILKNIVTSNEAIQPAKDFVANDSLFKLFQQATLDTLDQLKANLTKGGSAPISISQFNFIHALIEDLSPAGTKRAIDYIQKLTSVKTSNEITDLMLEMLRDKNLVNSINTFLDKKENFDLAASSTQGLLSDMKESLLSAGLTIKQYNLLLATVKFMSPKGVRNTLEFISKLASIGTNNVFDVDTYLTALSEFNHSHPDAADEFIHLVKGPAFPLLKEVLIEYFEKNTLDDFIREGLVAFMRGIDADGIVAIVKYRKQILEAALNKKLLTKPSLKGTPEDLFNRLRLAFKKYPTEIRSIIEKNYRVIHNVAEVANFYLEKNPPKNLDPMAKNLAHAFLRGLTGKAKMQNPDPDEQSPFWIYLGRLFGNSDSRTQAIKDLANQLHVSENTVIEKLRIDGSIDSNGQKIYPYWELAKSNPDSIKAQMKVHVAKLAEYCLENLGNMIRKGRALSAEDVALANRQIDHILDFLTQDVDGMPYVKPMKDLKKYIALYNSKVPAEGGPNNLDQISEQNKSGS